MRLNILWLFLIIASLNCSASRVIDNFNRDWRYVLGDVAGAEHPDFNDSDWQHIGLPHSFSTPYFLSTDFYEGYGWYRKNFHVDRKDLEGVLSLDFDGVFQEAEIYVNGQKAGVHRGGYTGFNVDMTPFLHEGDNVVAVRVSNLWRPTLAPRGGEHVFSGGIYRKVRLVKSSPVHVAWYGVGVTTDGLKASNGKSASVNVDIELANTRAEKGEYTIKSILKSPEGNAIGECQSRVVLSGDSLTVVKQSFDNVKSPRLWHPSTPVLYSVDTKIYKGSREIDNVTTDFGFRWFEWTADRGFFLNGEHYVIKGANAHQDQAGWGDAVPDGAHRRDVAMLKEAGFNFIRGSHYPHSPAYLKACDEMGLLFWSEAPYWATAGPKDDGSWTASSYPIVEKDCEEFEQSALDQLAEMIRIHRNHPSIVVWSMCNEPFFCADGTLPGVKKLLTRMVELSHKLDPTRPAAIGGAQRPLGDNRIDFLGDIAGYNGDGGTIADFLNPGIPNFVSEYGVTATLRPGKYDPGWGDLWKDDHWRGHDWRSGQAIWCAFDHGSIFGPALGNMGIIDYFRIPKRSWYWYRNEYGGIAPPEWPVDNAPAAIAITPSSSEASTDGTDDIHLLVTLLDGEGKEVTASPDVTLEIVSGPGEFPTGRAITFSNGTDIPIIEGKAAITIRAYQQGNTVVEARSEGLPSKRISLKFKDGPDYDASRHVVSPRPYVRYVRDKGERLATFGVNSPTFASSAAAGHAAGYAADGNRHTYWQPEASDNNPSFTLDTERGLLLRDVNVEFVDGYECNPVMEASADNVTWHPVDDVKASDMRVRFLRLSFKPGATLPRLSGISVRGVL